MGVFVCVCCQKKLPEDMIVWDGKKKKSYPCPHCGASLYRKVSRVHIEQIVEVDGCLSIWDER